MRNDVVLCYEGVRGKSPSHFLLREFENEAGFAMVDPSVVQSLELTRIALGRQYACEVQIIVKDGVRTQADNERLAGRLGWTDEGGLVARNSRHLEKYGGIAVDIVARYHEDGAVVAVSQEVLAAACRDHFDYVKADYEDGHVHADNRERAKG